jgi:hypothetical protein
MAMATKYSAGIILPSIAVALLWAPRDSSSTERYRCVMVFLAVAAGIFLLLNPRIVLHPAQFLEWMGRIFGAIYAERFGTTAGYGSAGSLVAARAYFGFGPGRWIGLALGATGLAVALVRCRRSVDGCLIALIAATLGFVALLAPARTLPFRYLSPLLPLVAVCAAIGMEAVARWVPPRLQTPFLVVVGIVGIAMTVPDTNRLVGSLAREDTRSEAGRWIRENVPASVPIVWLGEPESEPQVMESTASLRRRMVYVEKRYGTVAARVINRLYLLLMRAPSARDPSAHGVYRDPRPSELASETVCVVQAAYPLPMVRTDPRLLAAWTRGRIVRQVEIGPALGNSRPLLDLSDAFFLPLDLAHVLQPGPRMSLFLIERDSAPGSGT